MIRYVQHIPGFVSGYEPERGEVADVAALLEVPFIRRDEDEVARRSVVPPLKYSGYQGTQWTLMSEMKDGSYWVKAFLEVDGDELAGLPVWVDPKAARGLRFGGGS